MTMFNWQEWLILVAQSICAVIAAQTIGWVGLGLVLILIGATVVLFYQAHIIEQKDEQLSDLRRALKAARQR